MAMEFENNGQQTAMGQAMAQAKLGQTHAQASQELPKYGNSGVSDPFGFAGKAMTPGRMAYAPLNGSMGSEAYTKLLKELRDAIEAQKKDSPLEIRILPIDKNVDPNLHYNGYILTVQSKVAPELGVGYHIMLMAGTAAPLNDRTVSVPSGHGVSENVTIPFYPELALSKRYFQVVNNYLSSVFGAGIKFFRATPTVIPADFDHENKQAVMSLAENSGLAASTILVMLADNGRHFQDLNLPQLLKNTSSNNNDANLTFNYNFQSQQQIDFLKQPTRASIVVQASTGVRKNNQEWDPNSAEGPKVITEATGFIELMPVAPRFDPRQVNPMMGWNPQAQAVATQRLAPVFVLNSLRSNLSGTPGAILTNVLVAADLNRGFGWVRSFEPTTQNKVGGLNLTDVTAITIDMPSRENPNVPEQRPDFKNAPMTTEFLMNFLGMYCRPEMYLATDIPWNNHNSWYLSLFSDAARGEPEPNALIDKTMCTLVGEDFMSKLPAGTPKFATTPFLMERGYYEVDGQRRDVADIDYVAVCNYADATNNPRLVEVWTNSFLSDSRTMEQRMQDRRDIIQHITGNKATFTGYVVRVFWNGAYIDAGLRALAEKGITTSSEGRAVYSFNGGRSTADFLNNAGLSSTAYWNSNMAGSSGRFNFNMSGGSPWSTGAMNTFNI